MKDLELIEESTNRILNVNFAYAVIITTLVALLFTIQQDRIIEIDNKIDLLIELQKPTK